MNFTGTIFCFFFVYLIPIALHFRCLSNNSTGGSEIKVYFKKGDSLIESKDSLITQSEALTNP
jgi:hypothetical protein